MKTFILPIGKKFGRLTILAEGPLHREPSGHSRRMVVCKCDCGGEKTCQYVSLQKGITKSCGCYHSERVIATHRIHGHSFIDGKHSPTYRVWHGMEQRCRNPNSKHYDCYGGRGITLCDEWKEFKNFLRDMGEKPEGLSIERIDNSKGYCKENCCWATRTQQARNTRRNKFLTFNGQTKCLSEWASEIGIHRNGLGWRLKQGWSVERTLTERSARAIVS